MSSLGCKGDLTLSVNGGLCPYGQSIIFERYCCDNKAIYGTKKRFSRIILVLILDTTTASCKAGGVLGPAVNGVCATNYFVTKGNMCCPKEDIYCRLITSQCSLIQFFQSRVVKFGFEIIEIIDK